MATASVRFTRQASKGSISRLKSRGCICPASQINLLIIDDMGMKQLPRRSGEYLLEIIMRRHENRATMMTSNRPLEDWAKLIGDVPSATAILDRFLQHAAIISITGKSYRLRNRGGGKADKAGVTAHHGNDSSPQDIGANPGTASGAEQEPAGAV
jgi:hypothetical protein